MLDKEVFDELKKIIAANPDPVVLKSALTKDKLANALNNSISKLKLGSIFMETILGIYDLDEFVSDYLLSIARK